jgi:hypothetical protein
MVQAIQNYIEKGEKWSHDKTIIILILVDKHCSKHYQKIYQFSLELHGFGH